MREPIASAVNWTDLGSGSLGRESDDGSLFYGVAKWDLQARDECTADSGYAFRYGVAPTPPQLHASYAASACIQLANTMIDQYRLLDRFRVPPNVTEYDDAVADWVQPLIDYCMLHHIPSDPCPQDPLAQLLLDFKPIVDACEAQARVSVMGVIDRGNRSRDALVAGTITVDDPRYTATYDPEVAAMCGVPECDNVMYRLYLRYQEMGSCQFVERYEIFYPLINSYRRDCDLSHSVTWYNRLKYFELDTISVVYLPGPLPLSPSQSPSPSLPPSLSTSASTPPPQPLSLRPEPTLPVTPESRPPAVPTSAPTTNPPSPSPTTLKPLPTAPLNTTRAANASDVVRPAHANRPVPLPPTLASVIDEPTPPEATTVGTREDQHGGSTALQYTVVAVVAVAVLALLFVARVRRRRRLDAANSATTAGGSSGEDTYHTLNDSDHTGDLVSGYPPALRGLSACPVLPVSQLTDVRILGGGGFGVVYLVRDIQHDRLLASKRLAPKRANAGAAANSHNDELDAFVAEINLAASLAHERIVAFVGVAGLHKTALQALFEYMDGGDLRQYLDQRRPIADAEAEAGRPSWTSEKLQIAVDIADALAYLHSLTPTPVVHRDLKSRNVLLTAKDQRAKLGDFGISRSASTVASMTTGVGTSRWVAPEVILGGGAYGAACDVYSLGVVLSELDTHRVPFSELAHANGEPLADFAVLELVATQGRQPSFSAACPVGLLSLARACLSFEATLRPSAAEVAVALRAIQSEFNDA